MTTMGLMAGADARIFVRGTFLEIREEEEECVRCLPNH
jgi:hypothetical protein